MQKLLALDQLGKRCIADKVCSVMEFLHVTFRLSCSQLPASRQQKLATGLQQDAGMLLVTVCWMFGKLLPRLPESMSAGRQTLV